MGLFDYERPHGSVGCWITGPPGNKGRFTLHKYKDRKAQNRAALRPPKPQKPKKSKPKLTPQEIVARFLEKVRRQNERRT